MEIQRINSYSKAYIFDSIENYDTSVFTIVKPNRVYLIDTFCGPDSMKPVTDSLQNDLQERELTVINTHFHWDHVWGNCCFKDKNIISHELCRELLDEAWDIQTSKNSRHIMGDVEKHLPDITFKEKLFFHDDAIELFYSPGHTKDSISVFDHEEKVLYAGDNLEKPIIYIESEDIHTYISTLENYLSYGPRKIVASHTLSLSEKDIINTINYLNALLEGKELVFETDYEKDIHRQNLAMIKSNFNNE